MKTSELIKQAEELLGKCSPGDWKYRFDNESIETPHGPLAFFSSHYGEIFYEQSLRGEIWGSMEFIAFARNHMPEIIAKLKKYEEILEGTNFK